MTVSAKDLADAITGAGKEYETGEISAEILIRDVTKAIGVYRRQHRTSLPGMATAWPAPRK